MIQTNKVISRRLEMLTKRYLLSVGWTKSLITTKKNDHDQKHDT